MPRYYTKKKQSKNRDQQNGCSERSKLCFISPFFKLRLNNELLPISGTVFARKGTSSRSLSFSSIFFFPLQLNIQFMHLFFFFRGTTKKLWTEVAIEGGSMEWQNLVNILSKAKTTFNFFYKTSKNTGSTGLVTRTWVHLVYVLPG